MNQFFTVYLYDVTNNETVWFSKADGSATDIVILDDGWTPNVTKYVRDGEKTWSDVVEELECMTNVETRDEALLLIEKLNALVHRAARDIEEKKEYTVRFVVKSQFSNALNESFTYIISPPNNGSVITFSTDIQTAPPGQIRFKLTFKRTGAWIVSDSIIHTGLLTSDITPSSGYWKLQTTLPTDIKIPTPIYLYLSISSNFLELSRLFFCVNILDVYVIDYLEWGTSFNMEVLPVPNWMFAVGNKVFRVKDNTDSYPIDQIPYQYVSLPKGKYATFVSWRSNQPNVLHGLKIVFDNNTETTNTMLLEKDTKPYYNFFGIVTMTEPANVLYLNTKIGHSTGFDIEKIILVRLKDTSNIFSISDEIFYENFYFRIDNNLEYPFRKFVRTGLGSNPSYQKLLNTYDSIDIVVDNKVFNIVLIGNSKDVFTLRTTDPFGEYPVNSIFGVIKYNSISTIFN